MVKKVTYMFCNIKWLNEKLKVDVCVAYDESGHKLSENVRLIRAKHKKGDQS